MSVVVSDDAPPGACEWKADGKRCWYPGSIGRGTLGGGPWYCRFHFHGGSAGEMAKIVHESHLSSNRENYYPKPKAPAERCKRIHESPPLFDEEELTEAGANG